MNFAISVGRGGVGVSYPGPQAENAEELADVTGRLDSADRPVVAAGATTCGTTPARGSVALRVGPAPAPGLAASCCG